MEKMDLEIENYTPTVEDFRLESYQASQEFFTESESYWKSSWKKLRQNKVAMVAMVILVIIVAMCILGPLLSPYSYEESNLAIKNQSPSSTHWFGTDQMGRDIFTRVWIGGRISLALGLIGASIDMFIGVILGGMAGYFKGRVDGLIMKVIEILSGIPYLVIVVLVSLVVGRGLLSLIIAMTLAGWCHTARMVRGQVMQIKEQEYVLAARLLGTSSMGIIKNHIFPNMMGIIVVSLTFDIPTFIFGEAFLSYIGLGIQPPMTSWGLLASSAQQNMIFYPYQLFFPTAMISITMLSLQLLGDGIRDALDPRSEQ